MKKSSGLTVHDVARLAGVSSMTVSRALNTPHLLSAQSLKKVRDVIEQTGFVPNGLASGLRSSKAKLVAAVLPTLTGPVFQETIRSLNQALDAAGYQLMIGQTGYETIREDALLDAIVRRRPDGIVLVGLMQSVEGRRQLLAAGIPVVETWDLTPTPIDMLVGFSHEQIGEAVCRYLHAKGYSYPVLLTADDRRAQRRVEGFRRAAKALALPQVPTVVVPAPTTLGSGRRALAEALDKYPKMDSVFCSSDMMAMGVIIEAQARKIPIPKKLAIVGLGDNDYAENLNPPLTTVRIDGKRIGELAASMIVNRPEGRDEASRIVDIGFEIVERDSA